MAVPVLTRDATVADVRKATTECARDLIELRATPADKRGESYATDVREHADFILNADLLEKALLAGQRQADDEAAEKNRRGARSFAAGTEPEFRSVGHQVVEAEGFEEWAKGNRSQPFVVDVRNPIGGEVRNLIGGFTVDPLASGSDAWLPVATPQMAVGSIQRRRAFVRDLLSVQSTGLRVIPYVRETNQLTNETGAQMVSEGSAKPEVTAEFETYNAIVEKIAAWLPITDEIASDAPTLVGYITTRLEYMLMIREEQQVLAGTGTTPQLQGLATLSGTQDQAMVTAAGSDQDFAGTIAAAYGKIENVDGDPDGVVANPLDFWAAIGKRHANQFDNGFGTGAPGSPGASSSITWGERCIRTRALTSGTAWAGSWALGATLFDRQQTTVRVFDQHEDYAIRNLRVVLEEKRIALAWHRPALFVKCVVPTA